MFKILDENGNEVTDADVINISHDDIIILRIDATISPEIMKELSKRLKKTFTDNKFLILPKECEVGILKQEINILQEKVPESKVLKG